MAYIKYYVGTREQMARLLILKYGSITYEGVLGARNGVRVYQIYRTNSTAIYRTRCAGRIRPRRGTVYVYQSGRQLSSSDVLPNKEQNDSEVFTNTPTLDSELTSSSLGPDASSSATDLLSQVEDFAALGLGGYTPPGLVQHALEFLHVNAHLPWWASIVAATITLRLALFPLAVRMQRNAAKIANINPIAAEIHQHMTAYKRIGNKVAEAQEAAKLMSIYNQHGVNPLTALFVMPLVQIPVFISFFLAIKGMANLPLESMKTGGIYWFTDLTVPDPTYVLPLMACLAFISNIELGGEGGAPSSNTTHRNIKMFMRASAVLVLPLTITFPSVS